MMDREGHNECSPRFLYDIQMDLALQGRLLLGALYASIVGAIIVTIILVAPPQNTPLSEVTLAGEKILVTVADTPVLQERGLSGRSALNQNEGMLFVFPSPGLYGFWMKDMSIPIDIIWFDANKQMVDVWESATPASYPETRIPIKDVMYALEVPAGFSAKHALKKGDVLELNSSARYNR